jgi:Protein of unknown function (DUF1670)
MDNKAIERLEQKSVKGSIVERLNRDFEFGPLMSRVVYEQMSGYLKEYAEIEESDIGQISYLVVSEDEGAGKRIEECKRVLVHLTLHHSDDTHKLATGLSAVRQARIERMSNEAADQGGLITHEDLACLLSSSLATIKRDVKKLRSQGIAIPTRGQIQDIGKGVTHKRQIVADYLAGYTYSEIELRQRHSLNSIRRYCEDFVRIVRLAAKGLKVAEIRLITKLSERLIGEYQTLYQACPPDNEYLQLLLADPNRIPDSAAEVERGGLLR